MNDIQEPISDTTLIFQVKAVRQTPTDTFPSLIRIRGTMNL